MLLGWPWTCRRSLAPQSRVDAVRLAIIGLGGLNIPGSVGGRGRQLINALRKTPGNRIVALCDVDEEVLTHSLEDFKKRGEWVESFKDPRRVFESKSVDAVVVALPNHWHALATIWACQAGKDVYVRSLFLTISGRGAKW